MSNLAILDLSTRAGARAFQRHLNSLRDSVSAGGEAARTVAQIVDAVRRQGDRAVVRYMRQWTDPRFSARRIRITPQELARAHRTLDPALKKAIARSITNVRRYQRHILPTSVKPVRIDGAELGLRFTPVDSVGLCVPGGRAAYPSSVIMLAVPALAAGVRADRISVVVPPLTRSAAARTPADVSPVVLATCHMLGLTRVYRIGGAQAVAALAYGTRTVEKVDLIAGPGNVFVQLAKARVSGVVGIDGFYGPSEIVAVADASADARKVAADLLAQAEHDPGRCFVVSWSRTVLERVVAEVQTQKKALTRKRAIDAALRTHSAAVLVRDESHAVRIANELAAEHVNLAVRNPDAMLRRVAHGGEFFLGDRTPVAAGDYLAGPSHCLPTGTTARFASGVSVYTFLKRSGTVAYPNGMPAAVIDAIVTLAEAEGLDAHARSVRVRGRGQR